MLRKKGRNLETKKKKKKASQNQSAKHTHIYPDEKMETIIIAVLEKKCRLCAAASAAGFVTRPSPHTH